MPQRSPMWSRETRDVKQFPLFLYLPCISQSVRAWIGGMLSLQSLIQARKEVNESPAGRPLHCDFISRAGLPLLPPAELMHQFPNAPRLEIPKVLSPSVFSETSRNSSLDAPLHLSGLSHRYSGS